MRVGKWNAQEARRLYLVEEWSLQDLGNRYGMSQQTAGRRLREDGVEMRPPYARTDQHALRLAEARRIPLDHDRLRKLASLEMSTSEIGAELGVSDDCVRERMILLGIPRLPGKARLEKHPHWAGGLTVDKHGYILQWCPGHPGGDRQRKVRLHRVVMEADLGRYLRDGEVVDHIDGDTSNNHIENLRLFSTNAEHLRVTLTGSRKIPGDVREELRLQAIQRAKQRVAAILEELGSDAQELIGPIPWSAESGTGLLVLCGMQVSDGVVRRASGPSPNR